MPSRPKRPGTTAMITPMAADGAVDYDGAARLAAYLVDDMHNEGLVVNGFGATIQRSSAAGTPRFRLIWGGFNTTINDLTLRNGSVQDSGGGIYVAANLTLNNVTVRDCTADLSGGGVSVNAGPAVLTNCTMLNDTTGPNGSGGAVYLGYGGASLSNCTISGCNAMVLFEPPISPLAPTPRPTVALADAPT